MSAMHRTSARPRLRPLRVALATVLLVGALGTAGAQDWFGVRSGYPLGVTLHYGLGGALSPDADLRLSGRVEVQGGETSFGIGVDAITDVEVEPPFTVYVGGGPALIAGGDDVLLEVHGLAGAEFRFTDLGLDPLGLFLEGTLGGRLSLSGNAANSRLPAGGAALGVNWHF